MLKSRRAEAAEGKAGAVGTLAGALRSALGRESVPGPKIDAQAIGYRGPLRFGIFILLVFFGGFGTWAAMAQLESAAIAHGVVVVGSNRKTIQHLEGGIVSEIHVTEGSRIESGQPLVTLDETQPEAQLGLLRGKLRHDVARAARLRAQIEGTKEVQFPDWLIREAEHPAIAEIIASEDKIFESHQNSLVSQTSILRKRMAQHDEEIRGLEAEIRAQTRQLELIGQELGDVQMLVDKGLERRSRLLNLQRQSADIEGARARNQASIARSRQSIGESQYRIVELRNQMITQAAEDLRATQDEIADLWERIRAAQDIMKRTVIRAPVAGTVVNLKVFTTGGVIAPGQTLMDIVPSGDELMIEAKVDPNDIDVVYQGLPAQIRLSAFSARRVPPFSGIVEQVSADRLTDEKTGISYFQARVRLDKEQLPELEGIELYPGMQAEVLIVGRPRTTLSYLMKPLTGSFNRAMREN